MTTIELVAAVALAGGVAWMALGPIFFPGRMAAPAWAPDEPIDPLETPRGRALAALRELEFDRATGKIGDADYAELSARFTSDALEVLREDDGPAGPLGDSPAERLVAERAAALATAGPACQVCGPRPESDAVFCSTCGAGLERAGCAGCGSTSLAGARFCVECGTPAPA